MKAEFRLTVVCFPEHAEELRTDYPANVNQFIKETTGKVKGKGLLLPTDAQIRWDVRCTTPEEKLKP